MITASAFRWRGALLVVPAVAAIALGAPAPRSLAIGFAAALPPLLLRAWAFAHLGGQGRTRDPDPPPARVVTGPYAWVSHPVYVANLALGMAFLVAVRPPPAWAGGLALGLGGFYALLALRESGQLRAVPPAGRQPPQWRRVARWERGTWITTALFFALAALRMGTG